MEAKKEINTVIIKIEKNNRLNWEEAWNNIKSQEIGNSQFIFEVKIVMGDDIENSNITNLKYFFPILNEFEINQCECMLKVKYTRTLKDFSDFIERARVFFCKTFEKMYIDYQNCTIMLFTENFIDNELNLTNSAEERIIDNKVLNPIVRDIIIEYKSHIAKKGKKKIVDLIFSKIIIQKVKANKTKRVLIFPPECSTDDFLNISKMISENSSIKQFIAEYGYSFSHILCLKTKIVASDIFPIVKIDMPERMNFGDIIQEFDNYFNKSENYKGTQNKSINQAEKLKLKQQLNNNIEKFAAQGNSLEKVIFRALLRNFMDRKELFNLEGTNWKIDMTVLEKISADSKTYSEGIYQIIENACLYSKGRCAFFGMRIYNADRKAAMGNFERDAQNRVMLYEKYKHSLLKVEKGKIHSNHIFNNNGYSDYIEFYILDNAFNNAGIVTNYNDKNECQVKTIRDIVEITEEEYKKNNMEVSDYYTTHYGLRWFTKIVEKNNGCFSVISPLGHNDVSCYCSNGVDVIPGDTYQKGMVYSTEYNVLIPLSYAWHNTDERIANISNQYLFGDIVDTTQYDFEQINIRQDDKETENKNKSIHNVYKIINRCSNVVLFVLDGNYTTRDIEIFAKALFLHIYKTFTRDSTRRLYIAIDFNENRSLINEFVRIFSIFYDKMNENRYMKGVQIALASVSLANEENKEINFIISGENLTSAYVTANVFTYYNSENTAPFIPLLKYLTTHQQIKSPINSVAQFPFDLHLRDNDAEWFLKRMNTVLNTEMQSKEYGCKISNTHIRISSRIHLRDFYEAELLFHNIGNVYRFAYLIAQDILANNDFSKESEKDIIILGYENYSSILIQQIKCWIQNSIQHNKRKVYSAIVSTSENGENAISYLENVQSSSGLICYTVIPIGTTMSTVYKVQNVLLKDFDNVIFRNNYSIIAVCDKLDCKESNIKDKIILKYWKSVDCLNKVIHLNPQRTGENGIKVKYFLTANSKWYDSDDCKLCDNNIPLIQVDKTSTIPNAIFELMGNKRKFIENKNYKKKINFFEPQFNEKNGLSLPVIYSHLYQGNNHYQFFFNFEEYVNNAETEIVAWARRIKINQQAFNIVLSPLNLSNSKFLKIIIDNVFSSSLRFLHIDITNTYKEDARTKFSYIAKEYAAIKEIDSKTEINFYYIDDSIVTGQTINRGCAMLKMLVDESGMKIENFEGFNKIFLLINRSSYETLNSLLRDVSKDFYAFFNMYIPSYNTNSNFCPGCSIQKKYELLRKRSVSNALSTDFARLAYKHRKRTPDEYWKWLDEEIPIQHSYFSWLKSWLYNYNNKDKNKYMKKFIKQIKKDILKYITYENKTESLNSQEDEQVYLYEVGKLTIGGLFNFLKANKEYQKNTLDLMKYVISQRAFIRLKTMNSAYMKLQTVAQNYQFGTSEGLYDKTEKIVLQFFVEKDIEQIISYIKVISREQLSNYYHIRVAIVRVLIKLLDIMIFEEDKKDGLNEEFINYLKNGLCSEQKYQLVITVIHRLAMLQSSAILTPKRVEKVLKFFEHLYVEYFNEISSENNPDRYVLLTELPTEEKIVEKYMKSIKTATMLNNDDALCRKLQILENMKEGEEFNE